MKSTAVESAAIIVATMRTQGWTKANAASMSAHLYNRCDLDDGLMVTIKPITVQHRPGYLLVLIDLDSRMECGRRIFPTFESAHQYAESCFAPSEAHDVL